MQKHELGTHKDRKSSLRAHLKVLQIPQNVFCPIGIKHLGYFDISSYHTSVLRGSSAADKNFPTPYWPFLRSRNYAAVRLIYTLTSTPTLFQCRHWVRLTVAVKMKMKQNLNFKQNFQLSFNPNYSLSDSQDQGRTKWSNCRQAICDMDPY